MDLLDISSITGNNFLDITLRGDFYMVTKKVNDLVDWIDVDGGIPLLDADAIFENGFLSESDFISVCNKINEVNTAMGSPAAPLDVATTVNGMPQKIILDAFLNKINELATASNTGRVLNFEEMFKDDTNYEGSKFRITNGMLYIQELYTNHVLVSSYRTDTNDARGQYIIFGKLCLYTRDDLQKNQLGSLISELTTDTVFSFAFNPATYDWIPYHGQFTCWSRDFTRPLINVDGVEYDLYKRDIALQDYKQIQIIQESFGIEDLAGDPYPPLVTPSYPADSIIDIDTQLTITPRRVNLRQQFDIKKATVYSIGYVNMWSTDNTGLKYCLLQNGDKLDMFSSQDEYCQTSIHDFGFLDDNDFGCAVSTSVNYGNKWDGTTDKADRYLNNSTSTKKKLYFEILSGDNKNIGEKYNVVCDYTLGYSPTFKGIWDLAPEHINPS